MVGRGGWEPEVHRTAFTETLHNAVPEVSVRAKDVLEWGMVPEGSGCVQSRAPDTGFPPPDPVPAL